MKKGLSYLLDLGVEVKVVPVPGGPAHFPLDPLHEDGLAHRAVAQLDFQPVGGPVDQFEDGQLAAQLQAIRLHPCPNRYCA
jgi:hypothetical protein